MSGDDGAAAAAVAVGIFVDGPPERAGVLAFGVVVGLGDDDWPLHAVPAVVIAADAQRHDVDLFPQQVAHVADEDTVGGQVDVEAPRIAQAQRPNLFGQVELPGLAQRFRRHLVHVEAEDLALGRAVALGHAEQPVVAHAHVEHVVARVELHLAALVDIERLLFDHDHRLGGRIGHVGVGRHMVAGDDEVHLERHAVIEAAGVGDEELSVAGRRGVVVVGVEGDVVEAVFAAIANDLVLNIEKDADAPVGMQYFDHPVAFGDKQPVVAGVGHLGHLAEAIADGCQREGGATDGQWDVDRVTRAGSGRRAYRGQPRHQQEQDGHQDGGAAVGQWVCERR